MNDRQPDDFAPQRLRLEFRAAFQFCLGERNRPGCRSVRPAPNTNVVVLTDQNQPPSHDANGGTPLAATGTVATPHFKLSLLSA